MFISNFDKATILIEALPYIQKYVGKTIVVKYGGNAMKNEGLKDAVISDIVLLSLVGINTVLVHGGGPEINKMLDKVGIESKFVNGLRYTDEDTIDIVQMVLAGKTNKELVNRIQAIGGKAIGLCGLDGGLIKAKKLEDGQYDYGKVGEITEVNADVIKDVISRGYIPVVSTIAAGEDGEPVYNINADTAASKIAAALGAENLILLTDTRGVMRDVKDEDTLIPEIRLSEIEELMSEGVISGGMIPKVKCCEEAVRSGIKNTFIIDGRILHSILIELLTDEGIGTMFKL
ncbi:MAG: acetylglutamate kinase [Ruminococcaceae bacterium]|nr:acetylglutamate kinase [Oscillospiraceae bacterium]